MNTYLYECMVYSPEGQHVHTYTVQLRAYDLQGAMVILRKRNTFKADGVVVECFFKGVQDENDNQEHIG